MTWQARPWRRPILRLVCIVAGAFAAGAITAIAGDALGVTDRFVLLVAGASEGALIGWAIAQSWPRREP